MYSAEISIGTPPQRFSLLVDISSPETFVTSINCRRCDTGDAKYDSSRSSSHKVNGTSLKVEYFHLSISGNMTIDTFGIFGCYLKNQPFLEASYVLSNGFLETDIINGIVGLTPSSAGSALNNPSPFMSLVKEKVLDKNILSMRLRKPRELIFGSIDHKLFTGKLVQIPLTNKTTGFALSGRWQAEARYLTLGSKPGKRMSLAGYTASFSTGSAYMWLPKPMAWDILTDLQFEDHNFLMPPSVPCERRKDMPDITFNLAGQNFTLTPYDYTFTYDFESVIVCASAILPIDVEQHEEIILGSAFLRPFYSVFDLDSNTVGCMSAPFLPFAFRNYLLIVHSRRFVYIALSSDILSHVMMPSKFGHSAD